MPTGSPICHSLPLTLPPVERRALAKRVLWVRFIRIRRRVEASSLKPRVRGLRQAWLKGIPKCFWGQVVFWRPGAPRPKNHSSLDNVWFLASTPQASNKTHGQTTTSGSLGDLPGHAENCRWSVSKAASLAIDSGIFNPPQVDCSFEFLLAHRFFGLLRGGSQVFREGPGSPRNPE